MLSEPLILPDPWIPNEPYNTIAALSALSTPATGTLVGSANRALFVPVVFPFDATLTAVRTMGGNTTGNYDLGFYAVDPSTNAIALVASKGSTSLSVAVLEVTLDYRVTAGRVYYSALALSSTSGQVVRPNYTANGAVSAGCFGQDSALPLPSTATPIEYPQNVIPIFGYGLR